MPTAGVIDQVTEVTLLPVTAAVSCCVRPSANWMLAGLTATTVGTRVITAGLVQTPRFTTAQALTKTCVWVLTDAVAV